MEKYKEKSNLSLTSEKIAKNFKSSFELVGYAIHLAEENIRTGRDSSGVDNDNLVTTVMKELSSEKNSFFQPPHSREKSERLHPSAHTAKSKASEKIIIEEDEDDDED